MPNYHILWECHHQDELAYEAGTLQVPTGSERQSARVGDEVFFVGDVVQFTLYGVAVVINRIVYWHRVNNYTAWEYYQVDYEVIDTDHPLYGFQSNAIADQFEIIP